MTLHTYLQVKKFLLMLFCVFKTEVADPNIAILMGKTQTILWIWSYPPLRKTHVCPFSPDSHIDLTHPTDSTGNQWISRQFSAINSGPDAKFVSSGFHSKDR